MYEVSTGTDPVKEFCLTTLPFSNEFNTIGPIDIFGDAVASSVGLEQYSLRYIYNASCQQHRVQPNPHVLRQLPPIANVDSVNKVKVLDFSLAYLGNDGCAALTPVIGFCTSITHLLMPSVGLTEEVARPLLAILQTHPSLSWIDLSGNHLNDNVGRWILTLVLENPNIRFVLLRDSGISVPLVRKITHHLQREERGNGDTFSTLPCLTLDVGRLCCSVTTDASASVSVSAFDASRVRCLPPYVASGLAELRHRLYRNRHCIQNVYECFILPHHDADGEENDGEGVCEDALVDVNMNGEWDIVSISAMYTGQCSWRAFFRGLRLLGIHAASRSLTESVAFATICGICKLDTICFGKLLSFLRPHVSLGMMMAPWKDLVNGTDSHWIINAADCTIVSEIPDGNGGSLHRSLFTSERFSIPRTPSFSRHSEREKSDDVSVSTDIGNNAVPVDAALLSEPPLSIMKLQDTVLLGKSRSSTVRGRSRSQYTSTPRAPTFSGGPRILGLALEDQFKLNRFLLDRKMQFVADRLYDARGALRESLQPSVEGNFVSASHLASMDDIVECSLSFLGEGNRERVVKLLKPWCVEKNGCLMVELDSWLNSMCIPEPGNLTPLPFSLSEEKRMWKNVAIDTLQSALNAW